MHVNDQKIGKRAVGYAVGLMFASSIAMALVSTHYLALPVLEVFGITTIILFLLTVFFYNKVTTLITVVVATVFAFWQFLYNGASGWFVDEAYPFITEALGYVRGFNMLDKSYHFALAVVFASLAALLAFFTASKLRGSAIMLAVTVALFIGMWFYGHKYILVNMSLCTAVTVGVWAYRFSYKFENSHNALAMSAIPAAVIAALLTAWITPEDVQDVRSPKLEAVFDDMVDYLGTYTGLSRTYPGFSIADAGFPSTEELGGPVQLSGKKVMTVKGTSLTMLRGAVHNEYTGRGWADSKDFASYRYNSARWKEQASETFDLERPSPEYTDDSGLLYENLTLSITQNQHLSTIFTPMRPASINGGYQDFIPYFNGKGEMFTKHAMSSSQTYTIQGMQFNEFTEEMMQYMTRLEEILPPERENKMEELYRLYLPDGEVNVNTATGNGTAERIALNIAREHSGKFIQALAIRDYLMQNYTYTLKPSEVPKNVDFVDYFIQSGEGYCSYYASAMAVMARAVGIPSRYAEGYILTDIEPKDSVYTVTGKNAHAWAELYFEGVGWIPFDATSIGQRETRTSFMPERDPVVESADPQIKESETEEPKTEEPESVTTPETPKKKNNGLPKGAGAVITIAVSVIVLALVILMQGVLYGEDRLTRKYGHRGAIEIWWCEILDMIVYQDKCFKRRDGETAYMLAERIGKQVSCPVVPFEQLVDIVIRSYYSDEKLQDTEVELVARYYKHMRKHLIYKLTPIGYLTIRILKPNYSKI